MSPKIFSHAERQALKEAMLLTGFKLLKEYGMTHMSVDKITAAAGIGKSTFYNFFPSKEVFVYELVQYERKGFWKLFEERLAGREKMTQAEGQEMLRQIVLHEDSVYQYLTPEDEAKIRKALPKEMAVDLDGEVRIMKALFSRMENVREEVDYPVAANLLKIAAMAAEQRGALHEEGYQRTLERLFSLLFQCVFREASC